MAGAFQMKCYPHNSNAKATEDNNNKQQQQKNTSSINNKSKRFLQILINNTRLDIVYVRASPALFLSLSLSRHAAHRK